MPYNREKEVKKIALIGVFLPIVLVLCALIIPIPGMYFPTFAYWCALATILMGIWVYGFANASFGHVMKRVTNWNNYGNANLVNHEAGNKGSLGVQVGPTGTHIVYLEDLPHTTLFYGRWTVYRSDALSIEIWHDHFMFGGNWYYIQY